MAVEPVVAVWARAPTANAVAAHANAKRNRPVFRDSMVLFIVSVLARVRADTRSRGTRTSTALTLHFCDEDFATDARKSSTSDA